MEMIYWVLSRDCNQRCPHCYNDSQPGAPGLSLDDATRCVENLPDADEVPISKVALSGGEVLVFPELLYHTLAKLQEKYDDKVVLAVQTNGDLLDAAALDRMVDLGVTRFSVSSQDDFHKKQSIRNRPNLEKLFATRGFEQFDFTGERNAPAPPPRAKQVSFWGATEDLWIGPLWPRGRAQVNNLCHATPDHDFCGHASGAKGFLEYMSPDCSMNLQLADVYPCCPLTCRPLGDLRAEGMIPMLDRLAAHPVYRALNEGRPEKMGEYLGLSEDYGVERSRDLGNHCLWCDEFFTKHAPDLLAKGGVTERGTVDLLIRGERMAGVPERTIRERHAVMA